MSFDIAISPEKNTTDKYVPRTLEDTHGKKVESNVASEPQDSI